MTSTTIAVCFKCLALLVALLWLAFLVFAFAGAVVAERTGVAWLWARRYVRARQRPRIG